MKDFDSAREERRARDREFTIGGERFVRRASVRPEVMLEFEDMEPGVKASEALRIADQLIVDFIEGDDAEARYRALRAREDDALSTQDLFAVVEWLIAEQTGRPTDAPSPSSAGRESNGTTSKDDSSSRPAVSLTL